MTTTYALRKSSGSMLVQGGGGPVWSNVRPPYLMGMEEAQHLADLYGGKIVEWEA
jgi:hypothetical protein